MDLRVLNEWEHKVNECTAWRIRLLRGKHINRRKQHVLKSRRHLDYLHEFQRKFVLVPADKAANDVIVVCKKYTWKLFSGSLIQQVRMSVKIETV